MSPSSSGTRRLAYSVSASVLVMLLIGSRGTIAACRALDPMDLNIDDHTFQFEQIDRALALGIEKPRAPRPNLICALVPYP